MADHHENRLWSTVTHTPVGELRLVASERGLVAVLWEGDRPERVRLGEDIPDADHPLLRSTARQLTEYFQGRRRTFDLELDPRGTPFQQRVWRALLTIDYGQSRSYAQIARQIAHPTAARAVGAANGRNPISIIVPCHRVIGASGKLTGFAGGLAVKAKLLELEAANA